MPDPQQIADAASALAVPAIVVTPLALALLKWLLSGRDSTPAEDAEDEGSGYHQDTGLPWK